MNVPGNPSGGSVAVGIIMGSKSDLPIMQGAAAVLEELEVPFEMTVVSAHRTPQRLFDYASSAEARRLQVIIAGAGGAAHLPGMAASLTPLPVIGVPINVTPLGGEDALLSIVQMPKGIPVASVAIDNATNAGILAAQMLSIADPALRDRLRKYRRSLADKVLVMADEVEQRG